MTVTSPCKYRVKDLLLFVKGEGFFSLHFLKKIIMEILILIAVAVVCALWFKYHPSGGNYIRK